MNNKKDNDFSQKLKDKLKELFQFKLSAENDFQFDSSELDFGIYRIMNYKRKEIESFIENDLIKKVEKEFEKYKMQNQQELLGKIEEKKKEIKKLEEELGEKILKNGEIEEKFKDRPFAKEYLELKKQTEDTDITESIQSQTYNDLYNFFSRYYEDGDFISTRRYSSKSYKYAIPYNGEEVKLHWANFDQYYIKTGEVFKDYVFTQKDWKFIFKTTLVEVETGNVKGERRYFFLSPDKPVDIKGNICLIQFEYKPFTDKDLIEYPIKTKDGKPKKTGISQDDLNTLLKDRILDSISLPEPKKYLFEKQNGKTILEKHLYKFTRKITSDFFIHKDLKGFLERELDYFIKTEVLDIDSLDTEKERYFDRHITRAKVVKNIGKKIIEFLGQIEDFQKMLWEKKKFILKTDYVTTIDRIPEEFHAEIINNKEQLKEWEELGFGEINKKENLVTKKDLFGNKYKKLPVDTKYFKQDFKERLLEKLSEKDNLDDLIDGVLIKSENWQALNLLLEKYREKIKCIYIDPPYNTGSDEFLYKDKYQHSSWLSMIYDRFEFGKYLLAKDGVIFVNIDDNEVANLRELLENIFDKMNFVSNLIWEKKYSPSNDSKWFSSNHDHILVFAKDKELWHPNLLQRTSEMDKRYKNYDNDPRGPWKPGGFSVKTYTKEYDYPIKIPSRKIVYPPKGSCWQTTKEKYEEFLKDNRIWFGKKGDSKPQIKQFLSEVQQGTVSKSIWFYNEVGHNQISRKEIINIFGDYLFDTPKPVGLLERILRLSLKNSNNIVLDFFAGSGTTAHAVMKLNKEDGGKRKYILIEIAKYFDTVVIPRLKKICYSFNWKDGKPQDNDGISQMIKYHYLEQYEDTLHNIDFSQEEKGQKILDLLPEEEKSEYLIKYMLKFETEGSPSLLSLKQFTNPFEYKLKIISGNNKEEIVNIDLVETFNYLIGLKINKYRYLTDKGRKYIFVLGERNYRKVAIVWRSTVDINLEKDKENIDKIINDFKPEEIYINGDSLVKNYKPIESEFKIRAGV
jgi:adenine-specific DNA-methyltransferase